MTLYQKLKKLKLNLSAIGLEQSDSNEAYFCTPKGAKIIGWAGVDGIHYCTIRGFGEIIFAVSPMNLPGDYVHPIARNFGELLGLLMSCGSMDAIEQAHMWDKAQFDKYLKENPPTEEYTSILNTVKEQFAISPIDEPFSYIKTLQAAFDYSRLKYPSAYYDMDMNPPAEPEPIAWKVTFKGGFCWNKGRSGKEIAIKKTFFWGSERWYIPAVYVCGKGLVVDFCIDVNPDDLKAYMDKWDLLNENDDRYTREQREQMQNEHPLNVEFEPFIKLNGKDLRMEQGISVSWIPAGCMNDEFQNDTEASYVLEHYDLDPTRGWVFHRWSFPWATKRTPVIKSLNVLMERKPVTVLGTRFNSHSAGDTISFMHPVTAAQHTLTILASEIQQMNQRHFQNDRDKSMEYPSYYTVMTYTVDPEIPAGDIMLHDYSYGDRPRKKSPEPNAFVPVSFASIGVIGGVIGKTMDNLSDDNSVKTHTAYSALYFEQNRNIEWYLCFHVKTMADIEVELL